MQQDNKAMTRLKAASMKSWIKFSIAVIMIIAFAIWVGNGLWALLILLFFDLYITRLLPWGWWRNHPNPVVRKTMEWVDAISFALVAVYFINLFFFQNYKIPSSSLEKTLLVGDYLFVSKLAYGPRAPHTPLSFPLAQHTLPILECKSYLEWVQWPYKRLKGLGQVERNDIVVFNFPAGDTVAIKVQNPDYYTLRHLYGDRVNQDKATFGDIVYRPVDRRENYVKRCIGMPGDYMEIRDNQVYINGEIGENPEMLQFNYFVQTTGGLLTEDNFRALDISVDDRVLMNNQSNADAILDHIGFTRDSQNNHRPVYHFPLTNKALKALQSQPFVQEIKIESDTLFSGSDVYPIGYSMGWSRDNYGPIWIPQKGASIALTVENYAAYAHAIRNYEGHSFVWNGDHAIIDGKPTKSYIFSMDYYWMMGDNRHNSADSRSWGFVPEDHIVGTPLVVWLSIDKDRSLFDGMIRWDRIFTWVGNK